MTNFANMPIDEIHELEAKFFEANPGTESIIAKWMKEVSNKVTGPLIVDEKNN